MKLTPWHFGYVIEKLQNLPGDMKCAVCQSETWGLGDVITSTVEYNGPQPGFSNFFYPCVSLYCRTCGNTYLLNAIVLGVVDQATGKLIQPPTQHSEAAKGRAEPLKEPVSG